MRDGADSRHNKSMRAETTGFALGRKKMVGVSRLKEDTAGNVSKKNTEIR